MPRVIATHGVGNMETWLAGGEERAAIFKQFSSGHRIYRHAKDKKVAIVTAGGSGMGAAAARRLAQDSFNVAVLSSSGRGEVQNFRRTKTFAVLSGLELQRFATARLGSSKAR